MITSLAGLDWDVCEPHKGGNNPMQLTVNVRDGKLYCSRRAWEAAGKPGAFLVLYSSEYRSIGLRPCPTTTQNSTPVTLPGGTTPLLCTRTLTNAMRAGGYGGTLRVPVEWHCDGLLWGDLAGATQMVRRKAKKGGGE